MMPTVYRCGTFLACAVIFAACFPSALAQGIPAPAQGILDGPIGKEELEAKQKAWVQSIIKRRNYASEEQLRAQLRSVPEVGLDRKTATELMKTLVGQVANQRSALLDDPLPAHAGIQTLQKLASSLGQPELVALPWQPSGAQQLNSALGRSLQDTATHLHARLARLPRIEGKNANLKVLRTKLWGETADEKWDKPDCIPAITQILQAQPRLVRVLLVEQLAKIPGRASSEALAQRAVYDLSPQVREQALAALKSRPMHEYQKTLLSGLRWPWQPVTENASEAIATLQLKKLATQLHSMLQDPDPALPFEKVEDNEPVLYVKELVKMNHAQNCLLCHPQSTGSGDLVRGAVHFPFPSPSPGQRMPSYAINRRHGPTVMVRADNTTLRQEFSVMHPPVANPKSEADSETEAEVEPVPTERYDYFLRERRATADEIKRHQEREGVERPRGANYEREAVLYALHAIGQ